MQEHFQADHLLSQYRLLRQKRPPTYIDSWTLSLSLYSMPSDVRCVTITFVPELIKHMQNWLRPLVGCRE